MATAKNDSIETILNELKENAAKLQSLLPKSSSRPKSEESKKKVLKIVEMKANNLMYENLAKELDEENEDTAENNEIRETELKEYESDSNGMLEYADYLSEIPKSLDKTLLHNEQKLTKVYIPKVDSAIAALEEIQRNIEKIPQKIAELEEQGELALRERELQHAIMEAKIKEMEKRSMELINEANETDKLINEELQCCEELERKIAKGKEDELKCEQLEQEIAALNIEIAKSNQNTEKLKVANQKQAEKNTKASNNAAVLDGKIKQKRREQAELKKHIDSLHDKAKILASHKSLDDIDGDDNLSEFVNTKFFQEAKFKIGQLKNENVQIKEDLNKVEQKVGERSTHLDELKEKIIAERLCEKIKDLQEEIKTLDREKEDASVLYERTKGECEEREKKNALTIQELQDSCNLRKTEKCELEDKLKDSLNKLRIARENRNKEIAKMVAQHSIAKSDAQFHGTKLRVDTPIPVSSTATTNSAKASTTTETESDDSDSEYELIRPAYMGAPCLQNSSETLIGEDDVADDSYDLESMADYTYDEDDDDI